MCISKSLSLIGVASAAAIVMAAMPASAGDRCGGSLAIDAPTSLAKVARRCNVNLTALYEANPGVDPSSVAPGTYLAIPDEIDALASAGGAAASGADDPDTNDHDVVSDFPGDEYAVNQHRIRDLHEASGDPAWFRASTGGGARSYAADRLSYQQRSAARIHGAGVPSLPVPLNPSLRNSVSLDAGATEMISCAQLRNDGESEMRKVRKIISTPENTFVEIEPTGSGEFNCTLIDGGAADGAPLTPGVPAAHYGLPPQTPTMKSSSRYRLPDYDQINPKIAAAPRKISISGDVIGEANGCLLLDAGAGGKWALASAPGAESLVGKHVTAWGVASHSGACGAAPTMIVSHAVYAEPWGGK